MQRTHLLECATNKVANESAKKFGSARQSFSNIADRWSQILGVAIEPWEVGVMLADVQIARMAAAKTPDNDAFIDVCGYMALAAESVDG